MTLIETLHLSKDFGTISAVRNVTFKVLQGEIVGFLGPNGAGKSTTIRMLSGYLTPSQGQAFICGHSVEEEHLLVKESMGYMPEHSALYGEMRVGDFLHFVAQIRHCSRGDIERVVEICHLAPVFYQVIETLSKGYRKRVALAVSLIHDPPVLLLDEPTDGLDPNQKHEVRELIKSIAPQKAILLSTHILEEVEAICHKIFIIDHGELVAQGSTEELQEKFQQRSLEEVFRFLTYKKRSE